MRATETAVCCFCAVEHMRETLLSISQRLRWSCCWEHDNLPQSITCAFNATMDRVKSKVHSTLTRGNPLLDNKA